MVIVHRFLRSIIAQVPTALRIAESYASTRIRYDRNRIKSAAPGGRSRLRYDAAR
jgi:hypothetical protein